MNIVDELKEAIARVGELEKGHTQLFQDGKLEERIVGLEVKYRDLANRLEPLLKLLEKR